MGRLAVAVVQGKLFYWFPGCGVKDPSLKGCRGIQREAGFRFIRCRPHDLPPEVSFCPDTEFHRSGFRKTGQGESAGSVGLGLIIACYHPLSPGQFLPLITSYFRSLEWRARRVFHQAGPGAPFAHHNAALLLVSVHKQKLGRKVFLVKGHHPGCFHVHGHDKTPFRIRENNTALSAGPHALPQFGKNLYIIEIADNQRTLYRRARLIHHHAA
ncbi:MAG: hypothetical protein BWX80_00549 [Candidatus Hydrogenedentes bacterium ADurb.Bin101]|nr:MAG: hypothetical protein BWX80_00549 [Candidatus Hydrogenedentes bacterium ADurb.Bin101]